MLPRSKTLKRRHTTKKVHISRDAYKCLEIPGTKAFSGRSGTRETIERDRRSLRSRHRFPRTLTSSSSRSLPTATSTPPTFFLRPNCCKRRADIVEPSTTSPKAVLTAMLTPMLTLRAASSHFSRWVPLPRVYIRASFPASPLSSPEPFKGKTSLANKKNANFWPSKIGRAHV